MNADGAGAVTVCRVSGDVLSHRKQCHRFPVFRLTFVNVHGLLIALIVNFVAIIFLVRRREYVVERLHAMFVARARILEENTSLAVCQVSQASTAIALFAKDRREQCHIPTTNT